MRERRRTTSAAVTALALVALVACGPAAPGSSPSAPGVGVRTADHSPASPAPLLWHGLVVSPEPPGTPTADSRCPRWDPAPAASHRARRIRGWLHTCGTELVDAHDHVVRLLTIGVPGLQTGQGLPGLAQKPTLGCKGYTGPDPGTAARVASWGFNSVRLPIAWANLEPSPPVRGPSGGLQHHYNPAYLQLLDSAIRDFHDHGVAVVLDMSQTFWSPAFRHLVTHGGKMCAGSGMPSWLYAPSSSQDAVPAAELTFFANKGNVQQGFLDAWSFVARRYASDSTVVAADMINEPVTHRAFPPAKLRLNAFYARVGKVIRAANPRITLIFEDNNFLGSDKPQNYALAEAPPFPNEVYSFHLYVNDWRLGRIESQAFLGRAQRWDVPLWNGEWDMFRASSLNRPKPAWPSYVRSFTNFCRANDVGWTVWSVARQWFVSVDGVTPRPGLLDAVQAGF